MIAIGYIGSLSFHLLVLYSYNPFFLMTQRWQKAGINEINFFISPADEGRAIARDNFVDIFWGDGESGLGRGGDSEQIGIF